MFCSFQSADVSPLHLNLCPGIVFSAIVNGIVFVISFFDFFFMVYRNVVSCDFSESIINSNSFFESLGFSL